MADQPKLPNIVTQGKNFAVAFAKWVAAGKPLRKPEQVEQLFDFCSQCPVKQFVKVNDTTGRCATCGCWLRRDMQGPNKLKWPTEGCPHELWHAEVQPEDHEDETSPTAE